MGRCQWGEAGQGKAIAPWSIRAAPSTNLSQASQAPCRFPGPRLPARLTAAASGCMAPGSLGGSWAWAAGWTPGWQSPPAGLQRGQQSGRGGDCEARTLEEAPLLCHAASSYNSSQAMPARGAPQPAHAPLRCCTPRMSKPTGVPHDGGVQLPDLQRLVVGVGVPRLGLVVALQRLAAWARGRGIMRSSLAPFPALCFFSQR